MARDYKHEYQLAKDRDARKTLGTTVSTPIAEEFKAKCLLNNTTPNSFLRLCIEAYLNGDLTFDGESIKAQK